MTNQEYWNSVLRNREAVQKRIAEAAHWIHKLPEIARLNRLEERARERSFNLHLDLPGIENRRRRARLLCEARQARSTKIWRDLRSFNNAVQSEFDDLSSALPSHEIERRKKQIDFRDVQSVQVGLQSLAQRLDEFGMRGPPSPQLLRTRGMYHGRSLFDKSVLDDKNNLELMRSSRSVYS
jgi:hypothetical protein